MDKEAQKYMDEFWETNGFSRRVIKTMKVDKEAQEKIRDKVIDEIAKNIAGTNFNIWEELTVVERGDLRLWVDDKILSIPEIGKGLELYERELPKDKPPSSPVGYV